MPATKALLWFVVLGTGAAVIFFLVFPKYQPGFMKSKLRELSGFTPAKTPAEAVEKFREAIRKRDYETAALYTGGEYKQYLEMGADGGTKLARAIDDLLSNIDTVGINSPDSKFVLATLEPFPKDFKFDITQTVTAKDYKTLSLFFPTEFPDGQQKTIGDKMAIGVITFEMAKPGEAKSGRVNLNVVDSKIKMAFIPNADKWDGLVGLREEGNDKETAWKIFIPLLDVRQKVDYLKQNAGNFTVALDHVKYSVKHDAATKEGFEGELVKELNAAK
jgi:hypothetical protein